ncbi:MAG: 4Fe-4S dicluster domain-containing protein, partial [Sphingomonadaceae bacterium]
MVETLPRPAASPPARRPKVHQPPAGTHVVRRPVHPRPVTGRWRTVKNRVMAAILVSFFALPHVPWPRPEGQPQQALLFDFPGAHAYVFGLRLGHADLLLLMGLLLVSAMGLFFTNTLVGRVWCGFACPQTVWTDGFRKLDHLLSPRIGRGGVKLVWAGIALLTALTVLAYFAPARQLWPAIFTGAAEPYTYVILAALTLATFFLATLVQDMVCTHFCPWPRFQAVMVDRDTKIVTYQAWRGEPRGPAKRRVEGEARGDCVDCGLCVEVCPMGIDIREGSQLACIGCGLCADACDPVMAKLGRKPGLIRFSSDREQEQAATGTAAPAPRIRARTFGYGAMMLLVAAVIVPVYLDRAGVIVNVVPDRTGAHVTLADGSIRNVYDLGVQDGRAKPGPLAVRVEGLAPVEVRVMTPGAQDHGSRVPAPSGRVTQENYRLLLTAPPGVAEGRVPIRLVLLPVDGGAAVAEAKTSFVAPE